jgi:hypothetical protein
MNPNDIHYLAALLLGEDNAGAIVECGNWQYSKATRSYRDVDITLTHPSDDVPEAKLHGIEVKAHNRPLSSEHVDGLIQKLRDMPSISKHGIVSSSGFTTGAANACKYHSFVAYGIEPADSSLKVSNVSFQGLSDLFVEYTEWQEGVNLTFDFEGDLSELINSKPCDSAGNPSSLLRTFQEQAQAISGNMGAVIEQQLGLKPSDMGPLNVDTMVELNDCYVLIKGRVHEIPRVRATGVLAYRTSSTPLTYRVLRRIDSDDIVSAAAVAILPTGQMFCFLTSPSRPGLRVGHISSIARARGKVYKLALKRS